jgi:hypothetical protein
MIGQFEVMAIPQGAPAQSLGFSLDEANSVGLHSAE